MTGLPAIADWNEAMARRARARLQDASGAAPVTDRHAWQVAPSWNEKKQRWDIRIRCGMVNGVPAVVRIPDPENEDVDISAKLTADPAVPVSGARKVTGGEIPEFLQQFNIQQLTFPGDSRDSDGQPDLRQILEDFRDNRQRKELRTVKLVLRQSRPYSVSAWNETLTIFELQTVMAEIGPPRIHLVQDWQMPVAPQITDMLQPGWEGLPYDEIPLATLWFVGPVTAAESEELDNPASLRGWLPFVEHHEFWNLGWDFKATPPGQSGPQLAFPKGLGGGVGDRFIAAAEKDLNQRSAELGAFLNTAQTVGRFWSV